MNMDAWQWTFVNDLSSLSDELRSSLVQEKDTSSPFLTINFLQLLADSKSVDGDSGWNSQHIMIAKDGQCIALIPCYLKTHSYGEYVFDHAWASAYHQHGLAYYPKLVCGIPFTPVTGARALINKQAVDSGLNETLIFDYLSQKAHEITEAANASSLHSLFLDHSVSDAIKQKNMHQRLSVQFVWHNKAYSNLDDFMQQLTSRKRRSIRKERAPFNSETSTKRVTVETLYADSLDQTVMDAFYLCYQQTYLKRSGHKGYLSADFFANLLETMRDNICIVAGFKDGIMIAGSLFFYNEHRLYGRYWGALDDISGLHFECCYYRGIEFAIAKNIQIFNPGTQGEHKILRGFEPTFCYSNHYMREPAFDRAVLDFVTRERPAIEQYHAHTCELLPFKEK